MLTTRKWWAIRQRRKLFDLIQYPIQFNSIFPLLPPWNDAIVLVSKVFKVQTHYTTLNNHESWCLNSQQEEMWKQWNGAKWEGVWNRNGNTIACSHRRHGHEKTVLSCLVCVSGVNTIVSTQFTIRNCSVSNTLRVKKSSHLETLCNSVKSLLIFKIFALLESVWNLLQNLYNTMHLTLAVLLHYHSQIYWGLLKTWKVETRSRQDKNVVLSAVVFTLQTWTRHDSLVLSVSSMWTSCKC